MKYRKLTTVSRTQKPKPRTETAALPSPIKEDALSNSHQTRNNTSKSKKRKPIYRTATRKPIACETSNPDQYDDETFATLAAMEWLSFDQEQQDALTGFGVFEREEYIDVRVGLRHSSAEEFFEWAGSRSIGYADNLGKLKKFISLQLVGLEMVFEMKGVSSQEGIASLIASTRHHKVSTTIRSYKLPSGAHYYFSPYKLGSAEHAMWLLKCGRKYLKH